MANTIVSPAPHIHGRNETQILMREVLRALAPVVLVSFYFYGLNAILLQVTCLVSCLLTEFLIQKYIQKGQITISDGSACVTAVLLALNLPPATPFWVAIIGSIVAIAIAKMTFGGLGQNIFNPALVGRVFLLISFPVVMTT